MDHKTGQPLSVAQFEITYQARWPALPPVPMLRVPGDTERGVSVASAGWPAPTVFVNCLRFLPTHIDIKDGFA